jgi:hypothetical protein
MSGELSSSLLVRFYSGEKKIQYLQRENFNLHVLETSNRTTTDDRTSRWSPSKLEVAFCQYAVSLLQQCCYIGKRTKMKFRIQNVVN